MDIEIIILNEGDRSSDSRLKDLWARFFKNRETPSIDEWEKLGKCERWVARTVEIYLAINGHRPQGKNVQLIAWEDGQIVGELLGSFYADKAVVGGIHSEIKGGGTLLMKHFALLSLDKKITLRAISDAIGFYRKLGLKQTKKSDKLGYYWPIKFQRQAAKDISL